MDLEARPLRCFIAVAELHSFSRAARSVNVSQPALSATIKELERRLGFLLFDRSNRHVQLTAEGKLFLGNARRYVRESDILRQSFQKIRSNDLRISAAFHTCLIEERNCLLEAFLQDHDDVHLQILNDHHGRGLAKLAQGEIDLLITLEPAAPSPDSDLLPVQGNYHAASERIILSSRPIDLLFPNEHPLAQKAVISLQDLTGIKVVVPNRFHGVGMAEAIRFKLEGAGAQVVLPPEGNAIGVERFGALKRLPAVALNWFSESAKLDRMHMRTVAGMDSTHLCLVRIGSELRPSARLLWDYANRYALTAPVK